MKVLGVSLCLLFLSFFIKVDDSWAVDYLSPNIESCAGSNAYMMTTIPFSTTAKSIQVKSHSSLSTNVRKIYYQIFNDQGENLLDSTKKLADSSIYEGSGAGGGIEDLTEIVQLKQMAHYYQNLMCLAKNQMKISEDSYFPEASNQFLKTPNSLKFQLIIHQIYLNQIKIIFIT
jgi:hypothetical protein